MPTALSPAAMCTAFSPTIGSAATGWNWLGAGSALLRYEHEVETVLDALAEHLERHLDCDGLLATAREPRLTNRSMSAIAATTAACTRHAVR